MPTTGERLRLERERRQLTVRQAADATNIKADHIRAIEADDWASFAAPVYVRGFVRTYARHLRLDGRELVTQLDEELAGRGDLRESRGSGGLRRGPLDSVMLRLALVRWQILFPLVLGLAVILVAWWGWKTWQARPVENPSTVQPRLYQPRQEPLPATLPLPSATNSPAGAGRR